MTTVGYCDYFSLTVIRGWALDDAEPDRVLTVVALLGDDVVAETKTGVVRPDLLSSARHAGFELKVPPELRRRVGDLVVAVADSGIQLPHTQSVGQYQATTAGNAASDSHAKLQCLDLPSDMRGLTFLDVGCNEGFFCDVALTRGATQAVGLEISAEFISRGRQQFPRVQFVLGSWDDALPKRQFDIILLSSALHYAQDPAKLLNRLSTRLTPNGLLILEAGVHPWPSSGMYSVVRSGDIRKFPTEPFLMHVLLRNYAVRVIGESVPQQGDPTPRRVYHCRPNMPTAIVVQAGSESGKSTLARKLEARGMRIIEADVCLRSLADSELLAEWPEVLGQLTGSVSGGLSSAYEAVGHDADLLDLLVSEMVTTGDMRGDVDVYVVPDVELVADGLCHALQGAGYRLWRLQHPHGMAEPAGP